MEVEITKEDLKKVGKLIWPNEDNVYARRIRNGKWEFWYNNDYPMQHGNGEKMILTDHVVRLLLTVPEPPKPSQP